MENLTVLNFAVGVKRFKTSEKSYTIDVTLNVAHLTDADIVGWLKNSSSPKVWVQAKLRKFSDFTLAGYADNGYTCDLPRAGAKGFTSKTIDWKKVLTDIFSNINPVTGAEKAEAAAEKFGGYHAAAIELARYMDIDLPDDDDDDDTDDVE